MTSGLCFIANVFNVIIISVDNFVCVILYATKRMYRLLSLNPVYNHNHNHVMCAWFCNNYIESRLPVATRDCANLLTCFITVFVIAS